MAAKEKAIYRDPSQPVAARVRDLLARMTLQEKAGQMSTFSIGPGGQVTVSVTVKNVGERAGDEVVQLYIRDMVSSVVTPLKQLKGFERVSLQPGKSCTVEFTLGPKHLSLLDRHLEPAVEPGTFEVTVGGLKTTFDVR